MLIAATLPESCESGVVYTRPWLVEMVLDLAGYLPERDLASMVAFEPSAGDGAFLIAMVRRLVKSCELHQTPLLDAVKALQAFEIDPRAAERASDLLHQTLLGLNVPESTATLLSRQWIKVGDFLEGVLCFPIADFVIGNPPYIRLEEIPASKAAFYRNTFSAMRGRADIYVAFYQAALLQLRPGGVCAYICADRWMLNDYGSALRTFITTGGYSVRYRVEAYDVDAFETEVSAYPAITVIAHEAQGSVVVAKAKSGIETADRNVLVESIRKARSGPFLEAARFPSWFHGNEPWPCSSPKALRLLKQLESTCLPLESAVTGTRIGIGVATGADRVFITSDKPNIEADRILPLALAADLEDGKVAWSGHYLVNPWNELGLVGLKDYPLLESHLSPHLKLLANRHTAKKDRPQNWHKTIDRVNLRLFRQSKLYIADIKDRLRPALDVGETYPQHNLYWITSDTWDLKVLGALLMSEVGQFFIRCYGIRMRGGFLRFQAQYLRRIRVPDPKALSPDLVKKLRFAFEQQDMALANEAAMEAYQLDDLPE